MRSRWSYDEGLDDRTRLSPNNTASPWVGIHADALPDSDPGPSLE